MNLTEVAYYLRKYGPITALVTLFFILLSYTIYLVIIAITPQKKPPTQINPVFGKLSLPDIKSKNLKKLPQFELDTIEGVPITATPAAIVLRFKEDQAKLSYLERAYLVAKNFNFDTLTANYERKEHWAIFTDSQKTLKIDIRNFNFEFNLSKEWINKNKENFSLPNQEEALQFSKELLSAINKYPKDLAQGKTNITFQILDPLTGDFKITKSPKRAKALRIDFFRNEFLDFPIVSPNLTESQNYIILTSFNDNIILLQAQVKFFEILKDKTGIYPLITGDEALNKLKKGKAFFIKIPDQIPEKIYIKKMFLGYYDPDTPTQYFMPFYVFLGKNFIAYVPAVKDEYLQSTR